MQVSKSIQVGFIILLVGMWYLLPQSYRIFPGFKNTDQMISGKNRKLFSSKNLKNRKKTLYLQSKNTLIAD